ncbi:MAG: 50S ribosome-binding GTPase, partial [Deltaproteobacteria bacterium]|nr:50S ribosome-binding GTPase [Deltaproteobacteria bacterium]
VVVEDKLFATLDPTIRCLRLPNGDQVMVIDTVGFINRIPHSLIEAFKGTLEEIRCADLLLHLVDMTNPLYEEQIRVIEAVLRDIGAGEIPRLILPNKVDVVSAAPFRKLVGNGSREVCPISALTGEGIDRLLETVGKILDQGKEQTQFCFSPSQGYLLSLLRQRGRILEERFEANSIHVTALVTRKLAGQIRKRLSENGYREPK